MVIVILLRFCSALSDCNLRTVFQRRKVNAYFMGFIKDNDTTLHTND